MRLVPLCALLVVLAAPIAAQEQGNDPTRQFLEAWFAIEDPERREEANQLLQALAAREELDAALRVRAEIGLARIESLRDDSKGARERLEALVPRTKELPVLRRIILERLGRPSWFQATRMIPLQGNAPQFLDLDTGGLFLSADRGPRGGPEMRASAFLVKTEFDPEFGKAVPPMSTRPWQKLRTDEGNLCWVQVLSNSSPTFIRFITRFGGHGELLPAPRQPFCIGYNSKIEVWWHTDPLYTRYRIERRTGVGERWRTVKELEKPPFFDRDVRAAERYGYRITGITDGELYGLPVRLQATVRSRGVVHGRVELARGATFNFLVGDRVADNWDVRLVNAWQQGAMFQSHLGANLLALQVGPGVAEPRSPWDATVGGNGQLKSGDVFLVPLRGGGVARCEVTLKRTGNRNQWAAVLDYDAFGDGDVFPEPPKIVAEETEEGVRVRATVQPPYRLAQARVRDVISRRGPWLIPLDDKGEGIDKDAGSNDVREYSVVAVDAHGRRTLAGRTLVIRMPDEPVSGEFKIRYQQGYSIEQRKVVSMGEADIFFNQQQSNIAKIYFHSNFGIANVRGALDGDLTAVTEQQLYDRIVGVEPNKLGMTKGYIWANKKTKGENVLLVRTRHGGWAKLWISKRDTSGSWTQRNVHFKFVYNPRSATFEKGAGKLTLKNGVKFADLEKIEEFTRISKEWKQSWSQLRSNTEFRSRMTRVEPGGGSVADPGSSQEVLLEETVNKNLETARYSFSLGRRDRPQGNILNSVWDLQWRTAHLLARLAPNDKSTLTDLGRMHWTRLKKVSQTVASDSGRATVRYGHIYLLRKVTGNAIGATTLFRIIGLEPMKRLQIEWVSLQGGELKSSPGFVQDAATRARLRKLLASVPKGKSASQAALGGAAAYEVFRRLRTKAVPSVAKRQVRLGDFMPEFTSISNFRFVLEGDIGSKKIDLLRPGGSAFELLSDIADAANLVWQIDGQGRIRIRPRVLTEAEKRENAEVEVLRKERLAQEQKRREERARKKKLAQLQDVRDALARAIAEIEKAK